MLRRWETVQQLPLFAPPSAATSSIKPVKITESAGKAVGLLDFKSPDEAIVWLDGSAYPCRIFRRPGRMSLRLDGAQIRLACSRRNSQIALTEFIGQSADWLKAQIEKSIDFNPAFDTTGYPQILYKGCLHSVQFEDRLLPVAEQTSDAQFILRLPQNRPDKTYRALGSWLKLRTEAILRKKIDLYAQVVGVSFGRYSVRFFKTQWGSCRLSRDQVFNLSFDARLAMMPDFVASYVILHELCHCRIFNHSRQFWALVDKHCAQFLYLKSEVAKDWLSENDALMRVDLMNLLRCGLGQKQGL